MFKRRKTEETVPETREAPTFRFQPAPPPEPAQPAPHPVATRAFPTPPAPPTEPQQRAFAPPPPRPPAERPEPQVSAPPPATAEATQGWSAQGGKDASLKTNGVRDDWGVPPYRPAPPAATVYTPPRTQESQTMARTPFPVPPPAPSAAPSPAPSTAPRLGTAIPPGPPPAAAEPIAPASEPAGKRTLVVGRGISVQGTVQDAERLVVEGTVEASMIQATELLVAPGGVLRGEVQVQSAELAGTVDGTLTTHASLIIRKTGRLLGTARYRSLQVEEGGKVTGRLEMLQEEPTAPITPAAVAPAPQIPEAVEPRPAESSTP